MILGLVALLISNAALLIGTHAVHRRLRTGDSSYDLVLFLLLRLILMSGSILAAGLAGLLNGASLGILASAVLAVLMLRGEHKALPPVPRFTLSPFALVAMILVVRFLLQAWFLSPYTTDVLAYHLPKVAEWVRAGGFTSELGAHTHATFPAGFELIETWWAVFLRHDVLIELAGGEYLVLAYAAAAALARGLGVSEMGARWSGLLFVLTPGLQLQATSCLNDLPVAALWVAGAALLVAPADLSRILLAVGLGIGTKPSFIYGLPGLILIWIAFRKEERRPSSGLAWARAAATLAIAIGGFWYLRNFVLFGNPVHPVGGDGLIDESGARWIQAGPSWASLTGNLRDLLTSRLWEPRWSYPANLRDVAAWGPLALYLGLPALTLWLRDARVRTVVIGGAVSTVTVLGLVLHDPWSLRFILFVPALLCVAVGRWMDRRQFVTVGVFAGVVILFATTCLPAELPPADAGTLARLPWRQRTAADLFEARPSGSATAYFGGNYGPVYLLYGPDFSKRVVYVRARTALELVEQAKRAGVSRLFAHPGSSRQAELLSAAERDGIVRRERGRFYYIPEVAGEEKGR